MTKDRATAVIRNLKISAVIKELLDSAIAIVREKEFVTTDYMIPAQQPRITSEEPKVKSINRSQNSSVPVNTTDDESITIGEG